MKSKALIIPLTAINLVTFGFGSAWDEAVVENLKFEKIPWEEALISAVINAGQEPQELKIEYASDILSVIVEPSLKALKEKERNRISEHVQSLTRDFIQTTDYRFGAEAKEFGPVHIRKLPLTKVLDLFSSGGYDPSTKTVIVQNRRDITVFCLKSGLDPKGDEEIIETVRVLLGLGFYSSDAGGFVTSSTKTGKDLEDFKADRLADLLGIEKLLADGHDIDLVLELIKHEFAWCGTNEKRIEENSPLGQLIKAFSKYRNKAQPAGAINSEAAASPR